MADGPIHPARRAGIHSIRQRPGVHRRGCQEMDQGRRCEDGLRRARLTLGERVH